MRNRSSGFIAYKLFVQRHEKIRLHYTVAYATSRTIIHKSHLLAILASLTQETKVSLISVVCHIQFAFGYIGFNLGSERHSGAAGSHIAVAHIFGAITVK